HGAGGELAAVHALERLGVAAHDAADRVFRGEALVADQRFQLAGQRGILDQERVCAKDGAVLLAQLGVYRLLVTSGILRARLERRAQASKSPVELAPLHAAARKAEPFGTHHGGRPEGYAGGEGNAAFVFHEGLVVSGWWLVAKKTPPSLP